jgi:hypothetical protein
MAIKRREHNERPSSPQVGQGATLHKLLRQKCVAANRQFQDIAMLRGSTESADSVSTRLFAKKMI